MVTSNKGAHMKNLVILALLVSLAAAKININEASRYELMTIGGLDAGRADMLMQYLSLIHI